MVKRRRYASSGQGVVEYAGALVISVLFIGTALITLPPGAYEFLNQVQESILSYLVGQIQNIGQ